MTFQARVAQHQRWTRMFEAHAGPSPRACRLRVKSVHDICSAYRAIPHPLYESFRRSQSKNCVVFLSMHLLTLNAWLGLTSGRTTGRTNESSSISDQRSHFRGEKTAQTSSPPPQMLIISDIEQDYFASFVLSPPTVIVGR
jgi:hypothetical protein